MNKRVIVTTLAIGVASLVSLASAYATPFFVNDPAAGDSGFIQRFSVDGVSSPDGGFGRITNGSVGTVAGGIGSMIGTGPFWDIAPTTSGDTTTNASFDGLSDWIFSADLRIDTHSASTRFFELGGAISGDLFFVQMGASATDVDIRGDNTSSSGYATLSTVTANAGFNTIQIVYNSGGQNFDIYWNGSQVLDDVLPRDDNVGPKTWGQTTRWAGSGVHPGELSLDNVLSSENFIPEPSTLGLMAIGMVLFALRRRRLVLR